MKPNKPTVWDCVLHNVWFIFFSLVSVALIITSFFIPPTGIIDGSVLAATGEMFAFAALGTVIKAIDKGMDARVQHRDTSVTIGDFNRPEEPVMREESSNYEEEF